MSQALGHARATSGLLALQIVGLLPVLAVAPLPNVDLIYTTFWLAGALFFFRWLGESCLANRRRHAVYLGLAVGLALGTKTIGIAFLPWLLAPALYGMLRRSSGWVDAGVAVAAMLPGCLYWYGRNFWLTGNPLYPLDVSIWGMTIFPGWFNSAAMRQSAYHRTPALETLVDALTRQLDLRLLPLWLLAIGIGLLSLRRRGDPPRDWRRVWCSAVGLGGVITFWWIVPYNTQERFLFPIYAVALLPIGFLLDASRWLRAGVSALLVWHLVTPPWATQFTGWFPPLNIAPIPQRSLWNVVQQLYVAWVASAGSTPLPGISSPPLLNRLLIDALIPLSLALGMGLLGGVTCWHWHRGGSMRSMGRAARLRSWPWIGVSILIGLGVWGPAHFLRGIVLQAEGGDFYPFRGFAMNLYPAWLQLERATQRSPSTVAYAGTNLPYYLFGRSLHNRVVYVSFNGPAGDRPDQLHRRRRARGQHVLADNPYPNWLREHSDAAAWLKNLAALEVDYLFIARENLHGHKEVAVSRAPFPIELQWADQHPEFFDRLPNQFVPGEPWAYLYRVKRPTSNRSSASPKS